MNQIAQLNNYRQDFKADSPLYFPVKSIPEIEVLDDNGLSYVSDGRQAIVRTDTKEILGIHKSGFKLVPNSEVFPQVEEVLQKSELDLTDMTIRDEISNGGSRSYRTYVFPAHTVEISKGDEVAMRLRVGNSYDGSCSLNTILGAFRILCLNGMVSGETMHNSRRKHTVNLDLNFMLMNMNNAISAYTRETEKWKQWTNVKVTEAQAKAIFEQLPGINERLLEKLMLHWVDHKAEMGNTQWALFNALTYWSTHEEIRTSGLANSASIIAGRETRVAKVINSAAFTSLRMAA